VYGWEYLYVFSNRSDRLDGPREDIDISREDFVRYSNAFWSLRPETCRRGHPAPFPEELVERVLRFYTFRGNVVLDMVAGTGTVAAVAKRLSRRYLSIDISPAYCAIARRRVDQGVSAAGLEGGSAVRNHQRGADRTPRPAGPARVRVRRRLVRVDGSTPS
jgi:DNA modification methylase